MKVRRIVELLYQTYDPEQEIMVAWYGSENFETKAGVWEKAVEFFDQQNYPYELTDHIKALVSDAEAEVELFEQMQMDAYLERVREEQANV
jgi:hypothetical protein